MQETPLPASARDPAATKGPLLWLGVLIALPLLVYWPLLGGTYIGDDVQLLHNPHLRQSTGWQLCLSESYHYPIAPQRNEYRPVTCLSFWLQIQATGLHPLPLHAVNLLLHLLVALALYSVMRRLLGGRPAFAATSLFALHPLYTEAVALLVGRADLLATLLGLLAWRCHLERRPGHDAAWTMATITCLSVATLAKESAVTFVALLLLSDLCGLNPRLRQRGPEDGGWRFFSRRLLLHHAKLWTFLPLVVLLRLWWRGPVWFSQVYSPIDNPLVAADGWQRVATALWVLVKGVALFVWPTRLSVDYSYDQIPVIERWSDPRLWLAITASAVAAGLALWAWRRRQAVPLWALAGYLCLSLVTANLLFPIGTIFGERLLYQPGLMLAALLGWVYVAVRRKIRRPQLASLLALLLLGGFGLRTLNRSFEWRSEERLYELQAEVAPRSVRTWKRLADLHLGAGRHAEALAAIERAHAITGDWSATWMLRSEAQKGLGRLDDAIASARQAFLRGETTPSFYLYLSDLFVRAGEVEKARLFLAEGLEHYPGEPRLAERLATLEPLSP